MDQNATTIVIVGCLLVLAILLIGFASFAKGGAFHARFGNRIMQLRVVAQFFVVILIVVLAWLARG
jgi:hypothetical protein